MSFQEDFVTHRRSYIGNNRDNRTFHYGNSVRTGGKDLGFLFNPVCCVYEEVSELIDRLETVINT